MPHKEDMNRLYHIWAAATEAVGYAQGRHRRDLDSDRPIQHSMVRLLEIVGEAASCISLPFREAHPEIPWSLMVGMRNRMIHAYFNVNLQIVWDTVTESLPPLITCIEPILADAGML